MDTNKPYAGDFGPFDGRIWLNTAHQGPLPKVAVEAAIAALEQEARPHLLRDEDFFEVPRKLRAALGNLIGAAPEDIILGNSTSYGLRRFEFRHWPRPVVSIANSPRKEILAFCPRNPPIENSKRS